MDKDQTPLPQDDSKKIEELKKEIENLKLELEKAKAQSDDHLNGWKRAKADYINFKRETEKKQREIIEFANAALLLEIFPLVDQFKQAFKHLPKDLEKSDWVAGIKHIQSNLKKLLNDLGITEIPTIGEKFNPEFHEAIGEVESDQDKGTIVEEVKTGFKINDKVIQPAKVKIAKEITIKEGGDNQNEAS